MRTCLVNSCPPVTRYALASWRTHPVPIAFGEVRDLAEIEQATGTRNLELIGLASGMSSGALSSTNPVSTPDFAEHLTPTGLHGKRMPALLVKGLRRPAFELLSPSVVIRRRPQRDNPFVTR